MGNRGAKHSTPEKQLSPLSTKTALNNSKSLTVSANSSPCNLKTPTTTAGPVNTVFEKNSTLHKFHIDPELETGIFEDHNHHEEQQDHQQQQQQLQEQQQPQQQQHHNNHYTNNVQLNISGVNKSCTKFVGLTEFDEAKIPELPGDLNPNIVEQYNLTFEECFIPTLTAQQDIKDEFVVDKTHLLLPTESETAVSSDNENFTDCNDEKDPLAATFADEPSALDTTTDLESYQSAVNTTLNGNINDTMENIANLTMDTETCTTLQQADQTHIVEESKNDHIQQFEALDEDEPMDIDLNATMEIIQTTSDNIQHVEKILEHAENILHYIEEKKPLQELQQEYPKQTESSKILLSINNADNNVSNKAQHLEIEQSKHELSLNKSIELPLNNAKTLSSECIIETLSNETNANSENSEVQETEADSSNNDNLPIDCMNSSAISASSSKSPTAKNESKLNTTLDSGASISSQRSSAPNSPSFPIKHAQNSGFPHSFKKPQIPEEKDNSDSNVSQAETDNSSEQMDSIHNNSDGTHVETTAESSNSLEIEATTNNDCHTSDADNSISNDTNQFSENNAEFTTSAARDKRQTFVLNQKDSASEKRRTFNIRSKESASSVDDQLHSSDNLDNLHHTGCLNSTGNVLQVTCSSSTKTGVNSRRTFNVVSEDLPKEEATAMDTSCEPMDVDETISTIPTESNTEQISQSLPLPHMNQNSQSPPLPNMKQITQSPPLPNMQQIPQPPTLPTVQENSQSPLLSSVQEKLQSPLSTMQEETQSPPLPTMQQKSQSPPLPTMQQKSQSPPLPTIQQKSQSPPLPIMQQKSQSPPLPTMQQQQSKDQLTSPNLFNQQNPIQIKEEQITPPNEPSILPLPPQAPLLSKRIQKRPPIRDLRDHGDILSAKEQSNIKVKDEKDIFVEKFTPSSIEDMFTTASTTSIALTNSSGFSEFDQTSSSSLSSMTTNGEQYQQEQQQFDDEFSGNNNLILNPSDFDYLLTKGNNNTVVDRSSLLLKFDPLLGVPVPVNQGQQQYQQLQQLQIPTNSINPCLSPTLEEEEHNESNHSFVVETKPTIGLSSLGAEATATSTEGGNTTGASAKLLKERSREVKHLLHLEQQQSKQNKKYLTQEVNKKNATMSVNVIKDMSLDNDCNKTFENSNSTHLDEKQINYKMDELEKKIKNEVLKTEDIEKKLKDAEQREEALIKRITEKDKTVAKMTGVIEAYEKAIAELIAEKEQLTQNYEKQLAEVKADRDSNYHHLTSLETTFSDLHVKYEKSKEMTCQLKASEEALQAEKRKNLENLHLQEQRYDKMKNHAMQQLEIANKKLESLTRDHSIEITKLKALLKKEEIARSSINEQLAQKTKENAELVKICDELISGQGS